MNLFDQFINCMVEMPLQTGLFLLTLALPFVFWSMLK